MVDEMLISSNYDTVLCECINRHSSRGAKSSVLFPVVLYEVFVNGYFVNESFFFHYQRVRILPPKVCTFLWLPPVEKWVTFEDK